MATRRKTVSDTALERRIYEQAAKEEEEYLLEDFGEVLDKMPPPVGWHKKRGRGRPRKKRRGAAEEFGWRSMMLVLLLRARHELTFREMASYLAANPELCKRMGLARAPSHSTISLASHRYPEAWLKKLNRLLLGDVKRGVLGGRLVSIPVWIPPALRSKE
jgi:hypothetical protein